MIRPLQPLELPERAHLHLIVIIHEQPKTNANTAEILAEIAALPLEGSRPLDVLQARESLILLRKFLLNRCDLFLSLNSLFRVTLRIATVDVIALFALPKAIHMATSAKYGTTKSNIANASKIIVEM